MLYIPGGEGEHIKQAKQINQIAVLLGAEDYKVQHMHTLTKLSVSIPGVPSSIVREWIISDLKEGITPNGVYRKWARIYNIDNIPHSFKGNIYMADEIKIKIKMGRIKKSILGTVAVAGLAGGYINYHIKKSAVFQERKLLLKIALNDNMKDTDFFINLAREISCQSPHNIFIETLENFIYDLRRGETPQDIYRKWASHYGIIVNVATDDKEFMKRCEGGVEHD